MAWTNNDLSSIGDGRNVYIRSPPNYNPVKDLTSTDLTCNIRNTPVPKVVNVQAGDRLTFECNGGADNVWVKLFQDGLTGTTWAVDELIAAHGQHTVVIPNIESGDYLLRAEIIALHEANVAYNQNPVQGAQLYPSCIECVLKVALA
ncbi:hypothetical protein FRB99_000384, partial [Tulasnella sp. 403]